MKNITNKKFLFGAMMLAFVVTSFFGIKSASAMIVSQLDRGDSGPQVTELQTYLSTSASIYPSGLVTGFFGPLTEAGVQRFQAAQGIVSAGTPATTGYGRVGPTTMARINALQGSPSANNQVWDTVPVLGALTVNTTNNSATLSWTTNEPTQGQVYYDTASLRSDEATGPGQNPYVSGAFSFDNNGQTSHTITIQNLLPSTQYFFLTRSVDNVGNITMTWPSTFQTR